MLLGLIVIVIPTPVAPFPRTELGRRLGLTARPGIIKTRKQSFPKLLLRDFKNSVVFREIHAPNGIIAAELTANRAGVQVVDANAGRTKDRRIMIIRGHCRNSYH